MNALLQASAEEMKGATLYLACYENGEPLIDIKPCDICDRLIRNARISYVVTEGGVTNYD